MLVAVHFYSKGRLAENHFAVGDAMQHLLGLRVNYFRIGLAGEHTHTKGFLTWVFRPIDLRAALGVASAAAG
jgi:hypothetical protein